LTVPHFVRCVKESKSMKRSNLEADVLYLDMSRLEYFYTPNPPGVIWLTHEEANQMFGSETPANCIEELEE
jgi:hypothetical protein